MKTISWIIWIVSSLALAAYLLFELVWSQDKSSFLIGEATHGHHQIELACATCHTSPFGGGEVIQDACVGCHGQELASAEDSHPKAKFTDPRNADRLAVLDATECVTCHLEHQNEQTRAMGVTLADDFCWHCHQDVAAERPSHEGMEFDTCASAGCHNYHDNKALYENFLVKHANEADVFMSAKRPLREAVTQYLANNPNTKALTVADIELVEQAPGEVYQHWQASTHATVGIACNDCHQSADGIWQQQPKIQLCQNCHQQEWENFTQSHHGMRLSDKLTQTLSPMTPAQGRLAFQPSSLAAEMTCSTCHGPHELNVEKAASESCLSCHADEHSLAFEQSPHGQLWQQELAGEINKGEGVSCATCHMPVVEQGKQHQVMHNVNHNLRPNEKMLRTVCMNCHGLAFSIDALADKDLIKNNFLHAPSVHIESIDMALERLK
ncbi:hypothetical protein DS2_00525 [Catenovulum agarivorans DS-2]|uniref:nitrite reductase (cytochrome; ammonia-forming) n=1 Tax=Catenovulum agarivorans DS-2 TaxID=1328313 RepID=W7QT24_9ALTE|nr:ammonia-forming cytochrome c nitrite reductase subunit c552 [Catenovulum agarivorans]EWH12162.1 hypothetical protein DS2_00525 [Catenovulum agarivorans DS-2]